MKSAHSIPSIAPRWLLAMMLLALAFGSAGTWAQDEAEVPGAVYISLGESLVVNYGGQGRLKYLRADISLRTTNSREAAIVRHHLPLIRGNLVLLFSRQDEQAVNTQTGREQLRQLALQEVNELLVEEEGRPNLVRDLLFNNFIVQH